MNPMLSLSNLCVSRQNNLVLRGIDLEVSEGEFVGLIGPNGAGKSTLLKAVLDLLPSSGVIKVSGTGIRQMTRTERAQQIGYLSQEREIHWPLPVRDLVRLGGAGEENAANAMERMDVTALSNSKATELSGGEQARVLVARALAQHTPLLLADEPVAGLDPAHQIRLMQEFVALANEGKTIVACLHELPLASQHCTRIIVLDKGEIVADGIPDTVLTDQLLASVYGIEASFVVTPKQRICVPTRLSPAVRQSHTPKPERT